MKIFLTGACGYKGSVLVPKLLKAGHEVVAFDIMWFGNFLEPHPDLTVVQGDVRNPDEYVAAVSRILESREERVRLAEAGRARVLSHHVWRNSMMRLDGILAEALDRRAAEKKTAASFAA